MHVFVCLDLNCEVPIIGINSVLSVLFVKNSQCLKSNKVDSGKLSVYSVQMR